MLHVQGVEDKSGFAWVVGKMTSYAKDATRLDRVILLIACGLASLVVIQMAFWETRQQETMDKISDIVVMHNAEIAELREIARANRRDIERNGR